MSDWIEDLTDAIADRFGIEARAELSDFIRHRIREDPSDDRSERIMTPTQDESAVHAAARELNEAQERLSQRGCSLKERAIADILRKHFPGDMTSPTDQPDEARCCPECGSIACLPCNEHWGDWECGSCGRVLRRWQVSD